LSSPEVSTPDASRRVEKGRSFGRADPYEVPESPRKIGEEERAVHKPRSKRRGPKPKPKDRPNTRSEKRVSIDPTRVSETAEELVELEDIEHGSAKQAISSRLRRRSGSFVAGNVAKKPKRTTRVAKARISEGVKASKQPVKPRRKPNSIKAAAEMELEAREEVGDVEKDPDVESQEDEEEVEEGLIAERTAAERNGYSSQSGGVGTILMDPTPSPINIIRPAPAQISHAPDLELEGRGSIDITDDIPRVSRQSTAQTEREYNFIDKRVLDQMLLFMRRVGRNKSGKKVVTDVEILSEPGRKMTNLVNTLLERYKSILELASEDNTDVEEIEQEGRQALLLVNRLEKMTREVLTSRLGNPAEGEDNANSSRGRNIVKDLYMHVLPGIVKVLGEVAKLNQTHGKEITRLVKVLYTLSKAALGEKTQPKDPPRNNFYYMKQPTKRLLNIVSKLHDELMEQARVEEARRTAPERAKKWKEQKDLKAREEEEEFRQRQNEINIANWKSLNEVRARLGLPPCLPEIRARASSQRPVETLGERGRSNLHPASRKRVWSNFEMGTLIEGLRQEHGKPLLLYNIK
jgi:hypothetical protein